MEYRDRAAGWQHAKLSGHKNEVLVKTLLDEDTHFQNSFLCQVDEAEAQIVATSVGGLHETNVPGVNGRKTKSKTDLKVSINTGKTINVSIKKSPCGQVYFVRAGLFIDTFEKQFNTRIPANVQRAINLFWAAADDAVSIIENFGNKSVEKFFDLQMKRKSLNATTLKAYDEHLYYALLSWFADNIYNITKLSFAMGAVRDCSEWSDFVWYINLLEENSINDIFSIEDICNAAESVAQKETYYGTSSGGTTIQLPFGFVQWHQKQLQFHHDYNKIKNLIKQ